MEGFTQANLLRMGRLACVLTDKEIVMPGTKFSSISQYSRLTPSMAFLRKAG